MARTSSFRYGQLRIFIDSRYCYLRSQTCLGVRDGHGKFYMFSVATEGVVLIDLQYNEKISGCTSRFSFVAFFWYTKSHPFINTRRNGYLDLVLLSNTSFS